MRCTTPHKIILTCLSLALLNGCMTTAVVAGASALTATALYDQRSFKTMSQDHTTTTFINEKVAENETLQSTDVSVKTINHNTLLVGRVRTPEQRVRIYKIAQSAPHVRRIYNKLTVTQKDSAIDGAKDVWLAGHVQTALLQKKGLRSAQVTPIVNHGVVYLMGILPNAQQALATDAVRKVPGVKKVVTLFENRV